MDTIEVTVKDDWIVDFFCPWGEWECNFSFKKNSTNAVLERCAGINELKNGLVKIKKLLYVEWKL